MNMAKVKLKKMITTDVCFCSNRWFTMANFGWYMIYELKISLTLDIYPLIIRMSYDDWLRNFDNCQICNLTPETVSDDLTEKDWENTRFLSVN